MKISYKGLLAAQLLLINSMHCMENNDKSNQQNKSTESDKKSETNQVTTNNENVNQLSLEQLHMIIQQKLLLQQWELQQQNQNQLIHMPRKNTQNNSKQSINYECKTCGRGFTIHQNRDLHRKVAHPDEYIRCSACNRPFTNERTLSKHRENCLGEKTEQILLQTNHASHRRYYNAKLTNTKLFQFRCEKCNHPYQEKNDCNSHQLTCTGKLLARNTINSSNKRKLNDDIIQDNLNESNKKIKLSNTEKIIDITEEKKIANDDIIDINEEIKNDFLIENLIDQNSEKENNVSSNNKEMIDNQTTTNTSSSNNGYFLPLCQLKALINKINPIVMPQSMIEYKCEQCNESFTTNRMLVHHERNAHSATFKHKCDKCPKSYPSQAAVYLHKKKKHSQNSFISNYQLQENNEENNNKKEDSENNTEVFESNQNNNIEIMEVQETEHKCDQCNESFTSNRRLVNHKREIHNYQFKYKCDQCSKSYEQSCTLSLHKKNKHSNNQYNSSSSVSNIIKPIALRPFINYQTQENKQENNIEIVEDNNDNDLREFLENEKINDDSFINEAQELIRLRKEMQESQQQEQIIKDENKEGNEDAESLQFLQETINTVKEYKKAIKQLEEKQKVTKRNIDSLMSPYVLRSQVDQSIKTLDLDDSLEGDQKIEQEIQDLRNKIKLLYQTVIKPLQAKLSKKL